MKHTTLVIMAAGIGSRFGGGIKQLEPVGPNGEIIMDYSIKDAISVGFDKVVFIIRKDLEKDFREVIGERIEKIVDTAYAFQELDDLPDGYTLPEGRKKPWGTGQAILSCKDIVHEPFIVINADDYYGKEAFSHIHDYLVAEHPGDDTFHFCMAGFILKNTLSEHGGVTRGLCETDDAGRLISISETKNIVKTPEDELGVSGAAIRTGDGSLKPISPDSHVSMNMWGFTPDIFQTLEAGFRDFLNAVPAGDLTAEYLLPTIVDDLLQDGKAEVSVLETHDKWFGVTYREDKEFVVNSIKELIEKGLYN
ncbi:MAG: sugar phosphate nucleotidyltransferase [Eubacteriales bacterium]|nr:sugar phosphate nucleotidyltransferase [Eubacteriales bacterium]